MDVTTYASKETRLKVKFVFKFIYKYNNNNNNNNEHLAFITGKELFNRLTDCWCYKEGNYL